MKLTEKEKRMLKGEMGPGYKLAMEILIDIGNIYNASQMVPISSGHIVLSTYKSIFDAGVEVLEKFAKLGAKASVPTTLDPGGMDLEKWEELKVPKDYAEKTFRIVEACRILNFIPVWTCTPYLAGLLPRQGQHLAWTESSAIVFANSILGARTNRDTAVIDVAASVAGRTPYYGLHLDENRRGDLLIEVNLKRDILTQETYNILGYFMGKEAGTSIPVLTGLPKEFEFEKYKGMGAAAAASGGVPLFHIVGVTPEANSLEDAFGSKEPKRKIIFDSGQREKTKKEMNTVQGGKIDAVMVGCPHYTISEIEKVAQLLEGKKINKDTKFWVYTYKHIELLAERLGYKKVIDDAGATIITDTCMIVSPTELWGFKTIMTDSGKCAYYGPTQVGAEVIFGSIEDCVNCAIKGYK